MDRLRLIQLPDSANRAERAIVQQINVSIISIAVIAEVQDYCTACALVRASEAMALAAKELEHAIDKANLAKPTTEEVGHG